MYIFDINGVRYLPYQPGPNELRLENIVSYGLSEYCYRIMG